MKTGHVPVTACCIGLILSVGCVMPDQVSQIQKDLADVRHELREVQREQAEVLQKLAEVEDAPAADQDPVTRAEMADLTLSLQQVSRDVAVSDEQMNDLGRRMDRMVEELARGRQQITRTALPPPNVDPGSAGSPGDDIRVNLPPAGGPADTLPDPEALYNTAYTDFNKGNYALAISGFDEYVERFSDTALADNAAYWIGECHFSQGNFDEAVNAFDRMLLNYPESDKAAAGNLKKALAYLEDNQISQSVVQLHHVVSTYGGSDEAKIARDKLTSLGETQ
jgi:tol-pal system protein YbgF